MAEIVALQATPAPRLSPWLANAITVESQHVSGAAVHPANRCVAWDVGYAGAELPDGGCSEVVPVETVKRVRDEVVRPARARF
jgi:hypothetical protein